MRKLSLGVILSLISIGVFANGDPVERLSALIASANPVPRKIVDVQVLSEELYIRPEYYTEVRVKYLIRNNSDQDYIDIDYGFPVDYFGSGEKYHNSPLIGDYYSESSYAVGWYDDYIRQISFQANGKSLEYKASQEVVVTLPQKPERSDYDDSEDADYEYEADMQDYETGGIYRRWFYTQFSIKAGESLTLEVNYSLRNSLSRPAYSGDIKPYSGNASFVYDMSPAANWGDGIVRDLDVEINIADIEPASYLYEPGISEFIGISGLPFRQEGNSLRYKTRNFNFKNSKPLEFEYSVTKKPDFADLMACRIAPSEYRTTVSEEQKKYPTSNLSDLDFSTAWVASKQGGVGSKITIEFKKPTPLSGFIFLGGYHKEESVYLNNNRPKVVMMSISGEEVYVYESGKVERSEFAVSELIEFEDKEYSFVDTENITEKSFIYERFRYSPTLYVKKIEFLTEDIFPGKKYNDLCVSEIIFLRPRSSKPYSDLTINLKNEIISDSDTDR